MRSWLALFLLGLLMTSVGCSTDDDGSVTQSEASAPDFGPHTVMEAPIEDVPAAWEAPETDAPVTGDDFVMEESDSTDEFPEDDLPRD